MSDVAVLAFALAALVVSGRWLVHVLMIVTRAFGVPEFSVGFVVLAVSTSLPEIFVGISSARQGAAALVMATALGSNLVNMTLIIGLAALLSLGISTRGLNLRRDLLWGGAITLLPLLFMSNGYISRAEGAVLLGAFCFYVWRSYHDRKGNTNSRLALRRPMRGMGALLLLLILVAVLLIAAEATVRSATSLAVQLHIPQFMIGLFVLAFGTSLPELVTTVHAALLRRPSLALGNILGSNVADSGVVIGLAALVRPLAARVTSDLALTAVCVVGVLALLGWLTKTRKKLSMSEGLGLILLFFGIGLLLFIASAPASFT